jgi:hypothetical protein
LAGLTKEDGSGEVPLCSTFDTLKLVLDKYDIPYEANENILSFLENNNITIGYFAGFDGTISTIERVSQMQSAQGLKVGDTAARMKEIYGPIALTDDEGSLYYQYQPNEDVWFSVGVDGKGDDARVKDITVEWIPGWYKGDSPE